MHKFIGFVVGMFSIVGLACSAFAGGTPTLAITETAVAASETATQSAATPTGSAQATAVFPTPVPPTDAPTLPPPPPPVVPESGQFVHYASGANTSGHVTYIDNPITNGRPNATLLVTANWNPGGVGGIYNAHTVGVWYDNSEAKWAIFNQDFADMPANAAFNVLVPAGGSSYFTHTAAPANISGHVTEINNASTNGRPNASLLVTANWNPGGVGGTYNVPAVGVWYNGSQRWTIFNQDFTAMPANAAFNVLVPSAGSASFVHTATGGNTSGHVTYVDNAASNNKPNALLFVTANWNPGGVGGTYNVPAVGVWYDNSEDKWAIFNQNLAAMPAHAAFNVLVAGG